MSRTDAPIATRTLTIVGSGPERPVEIRIYKPFDRTGEDLEFRCDYEIDWPDRMRTFHATGGDPVQALRLALCNIGIELYTSSYHKEKRLKWLELGAGFGFPLSPSLHDLYEGDDKLL